MRFLEKFKSKEYPSKDMIKKVISALTDLIFFCINTDSKDPLEAEGVSI